MPFYLVHFSVPRNDMVNSLTEVPRTRQIIPVVEDDLAVRHSLRFSLGIEGFAVRTYADGNELMNC